MLNEQELRQLKQLGIFLMGIVKKAKKKLILANK
jgi:hypothetical protein